MIIIPDVGSTFLSSTLTHGSHGTNFRVTLWNPALTVQSRQSVSLTERLGIYPSDLDILGDSLHRCSTEPDYTTITLVQ